MAPTTKNLIRTVVIIVTVSIAIGALSYNSLQSRYQKQLALHKK